MNMNDDILQNPDEPIMAYYTDGVGVAEVPNLARVRYAFETLGWRRIEREEYDRRYAELENNEPFASGKFTLE
jgi:hypothetical protein